MRLVASLIALSAISFGSAAQGVPESPDADIGYSSPGAALAALRNKPGIAVREQNDWVVLSDNGEHTIWSITSAPHPTHPTAVKRSFVERDGAVFVEMDIQCGASKSVCDQVVLQFQAANDNVRKSIGQ